jgi:hypothetical protein
MKIKKEYIGSRCWSPLMSRFFTIEEKNGDLYEKLGILYIYDEQKPKLIKYVDYSKKRDDAIDSDGNGVDNNSESELFI